MKKIKISIIIPIYNSEKFLKYCIESCLNQILNEIEIILINDGSTDSSHSICLEYSKKYPEKIIYINNKNMGCSATRNLGIKLAHGEYIAFVDSDDYIDKNMYDILYNEAYKNDLDIVMCGILYHDLLNKKTFSYSPKKVENYYEYFKHNILIGSPVNKIFKKNIIQNNNIIFPINTHQGEDLVFCFKYLNYTKKIGYINEDFYHYQLYGTNSVFNLEKRKDLIISFNEIYNFLFIQLKTKNKKMIKIFYNLIDNQLIKNTFFILVNSNTVSQNNYKKYIKIYKKNLEKISYLKFKEYILIYIYLIEIYLIRKFHLYTLLKKIKSNFIKIRG